MCVDRVTPGGTPDVVDTFSLQLSGSMHKNSFLYAGADISADWIDVACQVDDATLERRFANEPNGHQELIAWLREPAKSARVVVEASGVYSTDLCLALHAASRIEVMVLNPRAARDYRRSQMYRSKTDRIDAAVLSDYARRMPFTPWKPPKGDVRELRQVARRIQALTVDRTREKERLHAAQSTQTTSAVVTNDIEVNIRHLKRRIKELTRQAMKIIHRSAMLQRAYQHVTSVRGIATKSAVQLLGELMVLPTGMSVRQWVAYAGLDVKHHRSGRSVERRARISKEGNMRIRRALFMPAQVAIQHEPNVRAFYEKLVHQRGKPKMVAVVAVMRKLLHAIYGMLKHGQDFAGDKFYQIPEKPLATA